MIARYAYMLDPGGSSGVACSFGTPTGSSGSASFQQETENIHGAAGAVVTVQLTTYTVTNIAGEVLVNGGQVFLNNITTITLDGSGNGSFLARVQGSPTDPGTIVRATFTITSVSIGQLISGTTQTISKVF